MVVDQELERLLEEWDLTQRRLSTRIPLIEEALAELATCESVRLDGYLGYGRTLRVNDGVRAALVSSAEEELSDLRQAVEDAREAVINRRTALALL